MIYLNVLLTVQDQAHVAKVRELLIQQRKLSLQEPGCERFELYQSTVDQTRFFLVERWASQAAVDAHRQGHAYTTIYAPQVLPLVTREGHVVELIE